MHQNNFLIFKLGGIGDLLMTMPALKDLHFSYPHSKKTLIVGKSNKQLIANCPFVDSIYVFDDEKFFSSKIIYKFLECCKLLIFIKKSSFSHVFILHRDWRWNFLFFLTNIKNRVGFSRDFRGLFLTTSVSTTDEEHEIYKYKKVFSMLEEYKDKYIDMDLYPSQEDKSYIKSIYKNRMINYTLKIAIAVGGASNLKEKRDISRWPLESYNELIRRIRSKYNSLIILIGGPSDKIFLPKLNISDNDNVVNFIGKLNLQQSFLLLKECSIMITHDCGPMHLGAAAKIPIISLFGPTYPVEKEPITNKLSISLWGGKDLDCSPCYKDGKFPICKSIQCMKNISVDDVMSTLDHILHNLKMN